MEVLTTQLRLRPELAGRRSPVGDGGDVEEEGGDTREINHLKSYNLIVHTK